MRGIEDFERTRKGENPKFYPHDISKNCIPQIGEIFDNGYTEEEMKMINETRKILENSELEVTATCVRVPIMNGHAVDMHITLEEPFEIDEIKQLFVGSDDIILCEPYPVTEMSNGIDKVCVGRIRRDISDHNSLHIWCTADNIRRGAAVNAIEILEHLERSKYES
ncbi:MAG: hypothetical protein IJO16_01865 [Clostridia bacterium]|nr:hypothetical protein [Clostridia bacterium]